MSFGSANDGPLYWPKTERQQQAEEVLKALRCSLVWERDIGMVCTAHGEVLRRSGGLNHAPWIDGSSCMVAMCAEHPGLPANWQGIGSTWYCPVTGQEVRREQ